MTTHPHHWYTSEGYDGGLHHCRKCDRWVQGQRPDTNDCRVSEAEHKAVAWLGQAGLFRTRLDAVQNGEQCVQPVSIDQLFEHAHSDMLLQMSKRHRQVDGQGCKPDSNFLLSGLPCAAEATCRSLDKAEGCKPDLNIPAQLVDTAAQDVLAERRRQIEAEGYTAELDDQYTLGQLADAAGAYAFWAFTCNIQDFKVTTVPPSWPWNPKHWKPTDQRKMLIKAGALILAEIARLDRMAKGEALDNDEVSP
ncbi:hypothetical protein EQ845_16730 [Pseudomonas putida]|uniref:hypothetical protein n=1 Tax=Pseudomonas putida TaxID=303 RepID=UPI00117996C5|nr:hypothetical protein [Pseudomonas putida]TRO33893.1 hypothetical protein EQ845_16730 [Pseudomonas putida]